MFSKFISPTALILSLTLGIAGSAPATAQTALQTAQISAGLYRLGVEQSDPLLIMTAAKLRKSLRLSQVDRQPVENAPASDVTAEAPLSWEDMLDMAQELSTGDDALLGLIEDIRVENTKGVATGQVYSITSIRAGGIDTYSPLPYTGGEYAEVYVEAKSATDLNIEVQDAKGRLVCSDTDISAIAYCGWRPAHSEGFTIIVRNKGAVATSYSLITN